MLGGMVRRPARTALTVLCVAAAFALFGVLKGAEDTFDSTVTDLKSAAENLFVISRVSRTDPLPISHLEKLDRVPGVAAAVQTGYLLSFYQDPKNWIGGYAVDIDREFAVFRNFKVAPQALQDMRHTRTGAIVGRPLAERYGWKVGDRVPLQSQVWGRADGSYTWTFYILGIYDVEDPGSAAGFLVRYDAFEEERVLGKGTVSSFAMRVVDASDAPSIARRVDALFANSAHETLTQSGKDLLYNRFRQLGDVKLMVRTVLGATLILMLFVIANTIGQSTRERLWEFGVLRSIGFTSSYVSALIVAEALSMTVLGAALGLGASALLIRTIPRQFGEFVLLSVTVSSAVSAALVIALLSAMVPAWRAHALPIVAILRRS